MNTILFPSPVRQHAWFFPLTWALLVLLPLLTLTALGAQEGDFLFEPDGAGATLTGYTGPGGAVVIPEQLGGKPVTTIGRFLHSPFSGRSDLTSVVIPNSVTVIGSFAFTGCTGLTSLTFPDGVTLIGDDAFSNCTGLTNVVIPNSVTGIGYSTFSRCTGLKNVTIPNSVTSIWHEAFAFCTGLTGVAIPNSVTALGERVFIGCTGLTSLTIGSGVTHIREEACSYCTGLTSFTIPNSVTVIERYAFAGCKGLTNVTISDSVTNIGDFAFSSCTGLTNVTIPKSVSVLGGCVFCDCASLASIAVDALNPNFSSVGGVLFNKAQSQILAYPASKIGAYTIPNTVTNIGGATFYRCLGLTGITIPNSVTGIGWQAFAGCTGLTSVNIPKSVIVIVERAFSDCISLASINMADGVAKIENGAFSGCISLTSITIPNSVTDMWMTAFDSCTNLTSVFFEGNAPVDSLGTDSSPFATVFYRAGTSGWRSTFGGRPTAVWVERPAYTDWVVSSGLAARFPAASGEADDPDGDGVTNHAEWFASTDPTQAASRLELELTPRPADLAAPDQSPVPAGNHAVYFRSVPGRYYGLQRATGVTGAWELQAPRRHRHANAVRPGAAEHAAGVLPRGGAAVNVMENFACAEKSKLNS